MQVAPVLFVETRGAGFGYMGSTLTSLIYASFTFLLFSIAEKNGWTQDALAFNTVATAWPEIIQAARTTEDGAGEQAAFAFEED